MIRHTLSLVAALAILSAHAAQAQSQRPDSLQPVAIRFAALVHGQPFACGTRYDKIGSTASTMTVSDFRFYVSRPRLVREDGVEVPLALTQDGAWQVDEVALLDFENGMESCANGTPETRDRIEGTVAAGSYHGVRFDVGLPFEKNHRDPTLQPSPLNLTKLFWNWNGGYKFMRIDLESSGQPSGWTVHLGSASCTPRLGPTTVPTECAFENRVAVDLPSFDPVRDVVTLDLATLLAGSNIDLVSDQSAGCMSGPSDADCEDVFQQFGLPWGDHPAAPQKLFVARPSAAHPSTGQQ
jgi:uncharacterized repeat protein (TIGR04052 family)